MQNKPWRKLGAPDVSKVAMICSMYHAILQTLSQLKLDILSGLCYNDTMIHDLFLFIASLGPTCGLKPMLELLTLSSENLSPPLLLLMLFCDMMTHYVTWVLFLFREIPQFVFNYAQMVYIRNEILGGQRDETFHVALTHSRPPPNAGPPYRGSKEQGLFGLL